MINQKLTVTLIRNFKKKIDELKNTEEMLKIENLLVESSLSAITISDLKGNLTYVNNSFIKMWGYEDEEEIIGKPTVKFWQIKPLELMKALHDKGNWIGEVIATRKDGSKFNAHVIINMVENEAGKSSSMTASFVDVTGRKKAEQALQESEKRYQELYNNTPAMYFTVTPKAIVKSVNDYGAKCLGYKKEELIGKSVWIIVYKDDLKKIKKQVAGIFNKKLKDSKLEFRKVRKNGSVIWVRERAGLVFNDKNKPKELSIICEDVTKQKKEEQKLQKQKEKCEKGLEKLKKQLKEMRKKLNKR